MACSPKTHPWLLNLSSGWVWKEWLHSTSAKWLVDLRADYNVAEHEHHLDWLTRAEQSWSWRILTNTQLSKYQPIICLSATLFSGIIATKLSRHMSQHMSKIQKGIGNNTRGSKHQFLVDIAVHQDHKTRQTNLSTTWIDFKKCAVKEQHRGSDSIYCQQNRSSLDFKFQTDS